MIHSKQHRGCRIHNPQGAETHRARHRMQRLSAMYTLWEGREGRGGLRGLHATTVSSTPKTSSLRYLWLQLPTTPAKEAGLLEI